MEQPPKDEGKRKVNPDIIEIDPWVVKFLAQWEVDIPIDIPETQVVSPETMPAPERIPLIEASVDAYETIVFRTVNSTYILHENEDGTYSFTKIPGDGTNIKTDEVILKHVSAHDVAELTVACGKQVIFGGEHGDIRTTAVVSIDAENSVKRV